MLPHNCTTTSAVLEMSYSDGNNSASISSCFVFFSYKLRATEADMMNYRTNHFVLSHRLEFGLQDTKAEAVDYCCCGGGIEDVKNLK